MSIYKYLFMPTVKFTQIAIISKSSACGGEWGMEKGAGGVAVDY